jgi:Uma2 family endonuclease
MVGVMQLLRPPEVPDNLDQRVVLYGMTWKDYELLLAIRGDRAVPKLCYLEGRIELMSPSIDHEYIKKTMARLVEGWAWDRGLRLNGFGSWTLKDPAVERGVEPDECYIVGTERKARPDLAIEVQWTGGGIDKLDLYRKLGVGEVWVWRDGDVEVYRLVGEQYNRVPRSVVLPELDLEALARSAVVPDQTDALRGFLATEG